MVALFTTAGGTSGSVEGIAHIGLSHFSTDTVPSVSISAEEIDDSDHRADFRINTRTAATANAAPTEKMRVTYDGKVGIGTASPTGVLHVTAVDTSAEAFRVDITDSDSTADSTPFVIDGDGRVGIGTASPVAGSALTLNGDGTTYEGIAFQSGGSTKWKMQSDGASWYHDSQVNTLDYNIRLRDGNGDYQIFHMNADTAGTLKVGIGTNSPDAMLHVSSGTDLDCGIIIEADTDNSNEADLPFMWFKQDGDITVHAIQATSNRLQIINNISASGGIDFALGTTNNTGTTDPSTGTTTALSIESDGGVQARKTVIKAVSSNTTLADEDSGKTIYWTAGTLTLPATAESGQQFVVINNTNGSATPALGTSNAIATNWTAHAAMADETARTYIAVAANTWIYIG